VKISISFGLRCVTVSLGPYCWGITVPMIETREIRIKRMIVSFTDAKKDISRFFICD
jgi:hypothetical protein